MDNPRKKINEMRRALRKKALGGSESAHQRFYSELTKTRRAIKVEAGTSESKSKDTSIEEYTTEILVRHQIPYKTQKRIRYINVDFYLPESNLVIQVNGCYWHVHDKCYPNGPKNEIQRKNLDKDVRTHAFVKEAEMNLLEIWGCEIAKEPEVIEKKIVDLHNKLKKELEDGTKSNVPKVQE